MPNQIMVIAPYWIDEVGAWVFDDPQAGLAQEPFRQRCPGDDRFPRQGHPRSTEGISAPLLRCLIPRLPETPDMETGGIRRQLVCHR